MKREGYVYIMTNAHKNVMYTGVTSNLQKRIWEHRNHIYKNSFTERYNVHYLVYYEGFYRIEEAITREKQIKKWSRKKKEFLINSLNSIWRDLYDDVMNDKFDLLKH
jgi:putative endonuclease